MKKYFFISIVLSVLVAALAGCTDPEASPPTQTPISTMASASATPNATPNITPSATENAIESNSAISDNSSDSVSGSAITIDITTDSKRKTQIPDPATAGKQISIILPDQEHYCYTEYNKLCTDCKENLFTDLSFAGFKKPVIATSFAVGSLTKGKPCSFLVPDAKTKEKKVQKGTCLLLMVTNTDKKVPGNEGDWRDKNYLVMLDYANKRCAKIKTYFDLLGYFHWYDMEFHDVTGDGRVELAVSKEYNHGAIVMEIFNFDERKQKLKKIFTHPYEDTCANYTSFSGQLLDNYKAVLEYKDISFSTTVSLLDCGYKKKQLDIDRYDGGYDDDGDPLDTVFWAVGLWKNGTLQAKGKKADTVFLYAMNRVVFTKTKKGVPQIKLQNPVMVEHRSCGIGQMYTYFQYNKEKETMELCAAKFKAYERSKK